MTSDYSFETGPSAERKALVESSLEAENLRRSAAMRAGKELYGEAEETVEIYVLQDGEVAGGIVGYTWLGWLHIDLLWVRDQGRRLGSQLLSRAEEVARERRCTGSRVETWDFQAPGFYVRHGYRVVGEVPEYPAGATDHILIKQL